ncbi:MAG: hypothetical protein WC375_06965 [Methanomassiliicoccales archaeon]|jgi:hypothetical protein
MGSEARAKRIGKRFPWPIGPMISRTLSKCGDCPERLFCIERHALRSAGPEPIKTLVGMIGGCPEGPAAHSTMISRTAARFVRENCKGCRALGSCCASVEWHAGEHIMTIEDLTSDLSARPLCRRFDKCSRCELLPRCIASWMEDLNIGLGSLLMGYFRMRWNCTRLFAGK